MPNLEEAREQTLHEDKWTMARRVVSDDHPADCPCIRDHLEVSFIHGMGVAEQRIAALVEDESVVEAMAEAYYHATWGPMPAWVNAGSHDKEVARIGMREALRALAGQTENAE